MNATIAVGEPSNKLTIVGNSLPPFSIEENGNLNGFSIELLELLIKQQYGMNTVTDRIPVPFARAMATLGNRSRIVSVNIACSEDRRDKYKWVGPYYRIDMALVGQDSDSANYEDLDDILNVKIAVVRDTLLKELLLRKGIPENNIVELSHPEQTINMLKAGRVQLVAHIPSVIEYFAKQIGITYLEVKYPLDSGSFYFAFSKDIPDDDIDEMQKALGRLLGSESVKSLYRKYKLKEPELLVDANCRTQND